MKLVSDLSNDDNKFFPSILSTKASSISFLNTTHLVIKRSLACNFLFQYQKEK